MTMTYETMRDLFLYYLVNVYKKEDGNPLPGKTAKCYVTVLNGIRLHVSGAKALLDRIAAESDPMLQMVAWNELYDLLTKLQATATNRTANNRCTVVRALKGFLEWHAGKPMTITPPPPPPPPIPRIKPPKPKKGEDAVACTYSFFGPDEETERVRYADGREGECVLPEEQVPGLCRAIDKALDVICQFAQERFDVRIQGWPLRVLLCKECPTEIYTHPDSYVTKKIKEMVKKGEPITEAKVSSILRRVDRIGGEFVAESDLPIRIYFRQFDVATKQELFDAIIHVVAHEYMHYMEYHYVRGQFGKKPQRDDRVSEAMADFFAVLFSLDQGTPNHRRIAKCRYDEWQEMADSSWPYAYARYFYTVHGNTMGFSYRFAEYLKHKSVDKLTKVFLLSSNKKLAFNKLEKG